MRKLFEFIVAKRHWMLFIFCEIISIVLIYRNNIYQQNMMLTSANAVVGRISKSSSNIFSYFDLRKVNQELLERNSLLEMEVIRLREQVSSKEFDNKTFNQVFLKDTVLTDSIFARDYIYKYITAGIVNNSTTYLKNYITINKGSKDGLRPDMGVVSSHGIVGIVATVRDNFSVIISLLNVKYMVSCKVHNTNITGPLSWKGGDTKYAYLEQLPTHAVFQKGDTVVTSGYSAAFPPGVMVGVIESFNMENDDNFYSLKVRLSTDFQSLNVLCVIDNKLQKEQKEIELEARKND